MRPLLTLALLGVLLIPTAQAVEFPFGSSVGSADYDLSPMAESQRVALCYVDDAGDGTPSANDLIVLMTRVPTNGVCPSTLSTPSIVLTTLNGLTAGTEVNGVHEWGSKAVLSLSAMHFVRYFEEGSDVSKLDAKDTVYIDLKNVATPRVDVGDIRITSTGGLKAGQMVTAGDLDLNRPLADIRGTPRTVQAPGMVYKAGGGFYLNADAGAVGGTVDGTCATTACPVTGDFAVESGDIRLNPKAVNPLSDTAIVLPDHVELIQATVAPGQPFQVKVTAKNSGRAAGAGLIETTIDGALVDARGTPTIEPNGVATLVMTLIAPASPGQHIIKSGTFADFLTVGDATGTADATLESQLATLQSRVAELEADAEPVSLKTQGAPSPTGVFLLGCLVAVALVLRRRGA